MPALRRALAGARQSTAPVSTRNSASNPLPPPASLRTVVVTCVKPIGISYGCKLARTSEGLTAQSYTPGLRNSEGAGISDCCDTSIHGPIEFGCKTYLQL